jgi:Tfp pilus assembly protein PilN
VNPLKINLASLEYADKRKANFILTSACVVLLLISGLNVNLFRVYNFTIAEAHSKILRLENQLAKKQRIHEKIKSQFGTDTINIIKENAAFVNRVIALDVFPWNSLLYNLEKQVPEGLTLKSISPSDNFNKLRLKGRTDSMNNITFFLKKLDESELLHQGVLLQFSVDESNKTVEHKNNDPEIHFEIETSLRMDRLFPKNIYHDLYTVFKTQNTGR